MQIQLKLALKNPKILLVRVEVRPRLTRAWSDWLRYSWHFHPFCVFLSVLSQGCSSSRSPLIGSVTQSCLTLCDPMDCSTLGFPVHYHLLELAQTHVHWVSDAIQPSHPLLSPCPPIFPSIRVFSNELALCIRWSKYYSFSISPSNDYSELISFSIDWFDFHAD